MAIIGCPRCHKRISSKALKCRYCGAMPDGRLSRTPRRSFNGHYLLAALITTVGAVLFIAHNNGNAVPPLAVALAPYLIGLGIVWYTGARIWSWMQ